MKRTMFSLTILASLLLLAVFPYEAALTQVQKEPTFVVKGSVLVSAPIERVPRRKIAGGFRYAGTREIKPILHRLEFEGTLRGQRLDPNSTEIRNAVEQAIQSTSWTLDDNSQVMEAKARRAKGAEASALDLTARAHSTVRKPAISFDFSGQGSTKLKPGGDKAKGVNFAAGDEGSGQGLITGFRSSVKELKALNGARIRVKANYKVEQVDATGVARGRIDFELRSEK